MGSFASFLPPHSFMACLCACNSVCCVHVYMCVSVHEYIFGRCVNCTYMYCMYLCLHMRYVCVYLCEPEIVHTYGMCEFLCVSHMLCILVYIWAAVHHPGFKFKLSFWPPVIIGPSLHTGIAAGQGLLFASIVGLCQ